MAGAGFKTFGVGDVLTASDVNTYLMQQAVLNFADSGARGSAIGTAVLSEGMVSYLQDTNAVEVYDGSAWTSVAPDVPGIGSNVVQTVKTDTFSTSSTSFTNVTGMSVTITPTSATSRILVLVDAKVSTPTTTDAGAQLRLTGGNSGDYIGDAASNRQRVLAQPELNAAANDASFSMGQVSAIFVDSPGTTSPVTYQLTMATQGGTVYLNRTATDTDAVRYGRSASSITAIEVAA